MTSTERLSLPLLAAGQSQKEIYHNEALVALDWLVAAAAEEPPRGAPPVSPVAGQCWIVAQGATGAWQGQDHKLACFSPGGWRYSPAVEGMRVLIKPTGVDATYRNGSWEVGAVRASSILTDGMQVVGPRGGAVANPSGGTTIDAEARTAIGAILAALRTHGLIAT